MAVIDRDLGWQKIKRELEKAARLEVAVGIQKGTQGFDGVDVAEYAAYNEYGTDKIPSRPFMATSFDESKPQIDADFKRQANALVTGQSTAHQALLTIGLKHEKRIRDTITKRNFLPKLSDRTIAGKKGSTKTLVDSGTMEKNVKPVVRGRT